MIEVDVVGSVTVLTETDPAACDQAALTECRRRRSGSAVAGQLRRPHRHARRRTGDRRSRRPSLVSLADGGRRSGRAAVMRSLVPGCVRRCRTCSTPLLPVPCRPARGCDRPAGPEARRRRPGRTSRPGVGDRRLGDAVRRWRCSNGRCVTSNASSPARPAPSRLDTRRQQRNGQAMGRQGHRHVPHPPRARSRGRRRDRRRVRRRGGRGAIQARRRAHVRAVAGRCHRRPDHRGPNHRPTASPRCRCSSIWRRCVGGLHDTLGVRDRRRSTISYPTSSGRMCCDADIIPIVLDGDGVPCRRRTGPTAGHPRATPSAARRCTPPADTRTVRCGSGRVGSITSTGGTTSARPTSHNLIPLVHAAPPPRPRRRLDAQPELAT